MKAQMLKCLIKNEIEEANNAYNEIEKDKTKEAVLLSVGNSQTLEKSYPNFFTDTRHFIKSVNKILYELQKNNVL